MEGSDRVQIWIPNTRPTCVDMITYNALDKDANYPVSLVINLVINMGSLDTSISFLEF